MIIIHVFLWKNSLKSLQVIARILRFCGFEKLKALTSCLCSGMPLINSNKNKFLKDYPVRVYIDTILSWKNKRQTNVIFIQIAINTKTCMSEVMCHGNEISICICSLKVISETLNETLWTMTAENITKLCLVKSSKL